jgi:hypothetical protein
MESDVTQNSSASIANKPDVLGYLTPELAW